MEFINIFNVIVRPPSSKNEILDFDEGRQAFRIAIKAPPEDGKANKELLRFLKKETGRTAEIVSGHTSRKKLIRLV